MKVDVYPNITNVEVYENPISVPVEATWEKVVFTVPDPVVASYDLGRKVATDRDGDFVIQLNLDGEVKRYGSDFRVDGTNVVWVNAVDLVSGQELVIWYSPKSAYGSVPGSGEVTALPDLNDVTIEGPLAGDMLMRDGNGKFVNRKLTAGANVTIVSDGDGVTISSSDGADVPSATTLVEGTVRLATLAESSANSDTIAVTPAGLQDQLGDLATVAETGQYNDLLGKPALATVATSGDFNDLANKPSASSSQGVAGAVNVSDGNGGFSEVTWEVNNNHLLPKADDVYDIGSATQRVRDLYIGAQSIKIGDNNIPLGIDANGDLSFGQDSVLTDATLADVATTGAYADLVGAPTLSSVATSGAYADLSGSPTLSTVATTGAYTDLTGSPTLSDVATSGAYTDLVGAPALSNVATSGAYADLSGTPTISTVGASGNYSDLVGAPTLSNVATSGAYADLSGTPTISTVGTTGNYSDLNGAPTLSTVATSGDYSDLANKPVLATVATSGAYSDLSGLPSADDLVADYANPTNYVAADVNIDDHLIGIDNALGTVGGFSSIIVTNANNVVAVDANIFVTLNSSSSTNPWKISVPASPSDGDAIALTAASGSDGEQANYRRSIEIYADDGTTLLHTLNANARRTLWVVYEASSTSWLASPSYDPLKRGSASSTTLTAGKFGFEELHIMERDTGDYPLTLPAAADVELGQTQIIRLRGPRNLAITSAASDIVDPTETNYSLSASNTVTVRADAGDVVIKRVDRQGTAYYELSAPLANLGDLAPLDSPDLTGTPTAPTPALGDDSTKIATTAYVQDEITNLGGVNSLDDLSDVAVSSTLNTGEVLRYNGTNFVDALLASTDLSDTADLARLASPALTGAPTSTTPASGDDSTKIATTAYVQAEIVNMSTVDALNDLSDVTISGTSNAGDVVRYSGAGWVDTQLASTDLSDSNDLARTASLGTASSEDVGTTIGDVVQLVDVSGSASLPTVDASQLTGITATQVGAIADITNESLNDLGDVDFTAGNAIDGYVLTYSDTNSQWEAQEVSGETTVLLSSSNVTHAGNNNATITVTAGNNYIIDPSVSGVQFVNRIYFTLPTTGVDDPVTTKIVNLSSLPVRIRSTSNNVLYDSLGNGAPYYTVSGGMSGYQLHYAKGTINLYQSDTTGAGSKWYSYFDYAVENQSEPSEGDGIAYSEIDLANINIGQIFGDYVLTGDIYQSNVRAGRRYVTADNETVDRTVSLPNVAQFESVCDALDGRLMCFENRGTGNLRLDPDITNAPNSGYWAYVSKLDGTGASTGFIDLKSGESVAMRVERVNNQMYYRYIRQGFLPSRITETITATSTISTGTEHHKVVYVNNGATAVTITVPASANLRDGYQLTLKVLGFGAVTVNRSGTDTFDGDTSLTLSQNNQLSLIESATGWAVLQNDASSGITELVQDTTPVLGGNLDVSTFDIVSSSGNDIEVAPDGVGTLVVKGNTTGGSGSIKLNCEHNSHGVTIKSPPHASLTSYTLTLPNGVGAADELLKTDNSGNLSWSAVNADEIIAPRAGANYTALSTDSVTTHLGAIDTALGNVGGGGYNYSAVTSATNAQVATHYSCGAGNQTFTVSLPDASTSTGQISIKNMGTGVITIGRVTGTDTIDGVASDYPISTQYAAVTLICNESNGWEIM